MPLHPSSESNAASRFEFDRVPLTVSEAQGVGFVTLVFRHGEDCGRVKAPAEQDHCLLAHQPTSQSCTFWQIHTRLNCNLQYLQLDDSFLPEGSCRDRN